MSVALVAAVTAIAAVAASAATTSSSWNYTVNPLTKFAYSAKPAAGFPAPSVCEATFGLACYTPSEIRTGYSIPDSATGAGQTIVIVDAYGSPTIQQDLQTFDAAMGLPDPTLNIYYPGGKPTFNPQQHHQEASWAEETSLDVEWSHAIAPEATIDLVIAANNGGDVLNNAQSWAIDHHLGNVMSLSFGIPEGAISGNNGNNGQQAQAHDGYVAAKAANMTVFASAGDAGGNNGYSFLNAGYPASDPLVTGVGGTNLFLADDGSYENETVWNDSDPSLCPFGCTDGVFGATGGAPSLLYPGRDVADVGYNASVYTAVLVYMSIPSIDPGFYFFGGTSEGAPQWAGIVADADQAAGHAIGYINDKLAAIGSNPAEYAADFHDVTVGQDGLNGPGTSAGVGRDDPTGLGSPIVSNLIPDLIAP
ncbi:MAG TPA: S53 family peptidase [Gaiellaceae bacterium]|nr:S53 family peptidase [Gaiellaceae bacterium]